MRRYNFTGPISPKPPKRRIHPKAVMFLVGGMMSQNDDYVWEIGGLGSDGYFYAKASFLPSLSRKEREEFLLRVL